MSNENLIPMELVSPGEKKKNRWRRLVATFLLGLGFGSGIAAGMENVQSSQSGEPIAPSGAPRAPESEFVNSGSDDVQVVSHEVVPRPMDIAPAHAPSDQGTDAVGADKVLAQATPGSPSEGSDQPTPQLPASPQFEN